jgi:hypothetical protein
MYAPLMSSRAGFVGSAISDIVVVHASVLRQSPPFTFPKDEQLSSQFKLHVYDRSLVLGVYIRYGVASDILSSRYLPSSSLQSFVLFRLVELHTHVFSGC